MNEPKFVAGVLGRRLAKIAAMEDASALRSPTRSESKSKIDRYTFTATIADMRADPGLNLHRTLRRMREAGGLLTGILGDDNKPLRAVIQRHTVTIDGPTITAEVVLEVPEGRKWDTLRARLNIPDPDPDPDAPINTEEPS